MIITFNPGRVIGCGTSQRKEDDIIYNLEKFLKIQSKGVHISGRFGIGQVGGGKEIAEFMMADVNDPKVLWTPGRRRAHTIAIAHWRISRRTTGTTSVDAAWRETMIDVQLSARMSDSCAGEFFARSHDLLLRTWTGLPIFFHSTTAACSKIGHSWVCFPGTAVTSPVIRVSSEESDRVGEETCSFSILPGVPLPLINSWASGDSHVSVCCHLEGIGWSSWAVRPISDPTRLRLRGEVALDSYSQYGCNITRFVPMRGHMKNMTNLSIAVRHDDVDFSADPLWTKWGHDVVGN
ncbi:hypothetical protein KSP40_PGU002421 [Platanthera guangdongensis]|uniref:Uncharacterized protein n=1 Tax=Platanthera guangdongensis TaxID=2320717 RepID=A0ABR2LM02_9ASPA